MKNNNSSNSNKALNEMLDEMSEMNDKALRTSRRIKYVSLFVMVITIITVIPLLLISLSNPESKKFFDKEDIKSSMQITIENGGELSSVKHIYDRRENKEIFIDLLTGRKSNYYAEDYPLSDILKDLLVDYYKHPESSDSTYLIALKEIIAENDRKNPFDILEENQKYNFQNIQEKLDSTYEIISPDIIKIADELNNKNQLVNRYLNKSESSFTISIIALVISIILGLIQLYQNHLTSRRIGKSESIAKKGINQDS